MAGSELGVPPLLRRLASRIGRRFRPDDPVCPPPLIDDVVEALYYTAGGKLTAFHCPMDECKSVFGFGLGGGGWHPLAAAVSQYMNGHRGYDGSVLSRYFDSWQPRHAGEVVIGFDHAPDEFSELPPQAFVPPWGTQTPAERISRLAAVTAYEYREHGQPVLDPVTHGIGMYGPASAERGGFEYRRCIAVYQSIASRGYDRSHGDIRVRLIRHGSQTLFHGGAGHHRRGALAALGAASFPAVATAAHMVDTADLDRWPLVRRGVWTQDCAIRYVEHLLGFDSVKWATDRGFDPVLSGHSSLHPLVSEAPAGS